VVLLRTTDAMIMAFFVTQNQSRWVIAGTFINGEETSAGKILEKSVGYSKTS
jgi:hypothetical protein